MLARASRMASARPLTRDEKIVLAIVVLVPVIFNAIMLLPELSIAIPSVNDDGFHLLFVRDASAALANGENVFDFWAPQLELGFNQFFYYQHLPYLAVVLLQRVSLGNLDIVTAFNLTRYVLMVTFPLTVFWSMRRMGFSGPAAAFAAVVSSLLSTNFLYGFDYNSYTWRGFGLYTQLWGMHLAFLSLATMYTVLQKGRGLLLAIIVFSLLVLSHLVYAYMLAITIIVLYLYGINRTNIVGRTIRLAIVAAFVGAISAYMVIPFFTVPGYLSASPYLQPYKYDSFGAGPILTWLVSGQLFDYGRLPVLTVILLIGGIAALVSRARIALLAVVLFIVWLIIYFGRPTLDGLTNLFPLSDSLLFHRFIGGVDIAAIILMGVGAAALWQIFKPYRARWQVVLAGVAVIALLMPVFAERYDFYQYNGLLEQQVSDAITADTDAQAIIAKIQSLPAGRVFAGLPATYGNTMTFGDVYFYNLLVYDDIEVLAPPFQSLSLNSDLIWDFNDANQGDYDLFDVKYVVAPANRAMASFLKPIMRTAKYTLYQAPTSGFAEYGAIIGRQAFSTSNSLFFFNRSWYRGSLPDNLQFFRYDYPASHVAPGPTTAPGCADGKTTFEVFQPARIDLVTSCSTASTLIIKTTYHPNWQITVDGQIQPDFMVSPAFIGVSLPAGRHAVTAEYRAGPTKLPLLIVGFIALLLALVLGRRLEVFGNWATAGVDRRLRTDRWARKRRPGRRTVGTAPAEAVPGEAATLPDSPLSDSGPNDDGAGTETGAGPGA